MLDELRSFQAELKGARTFLPKPISKQLFSAIAKDKFKEIVDFYFRVIRSALTKGGITDAELASLDFQMQELLDASHKNSRGTTYSNCIKESLAATVNLERLCLTRVSVPVVSLVNTTDAKIIQTLKAFLPSAANSYEQAISDLQKNSRLSWRGPATDMREALRETLDHLAPDKEVEKQPGFRLEKDTKGPTMKQKVRFVLSKRNLSTAATATTESAVTTIEDLLGAFVRSIYTRSNVSTHTQTSKAEVLRIRDLVRVALCELLEIPT